jgi:ABC-type amino acid transport substrate-binding protein
VISRFIAIPLWTMGILMSSFIMAQIVSELTLQKIKWNINSIEDLYEKKIATISDTNLEETLQSIWMKNIIWVQTIKESYELFEEWKISAIWLDLPDILDLNTKFNHNWIESKILIKNITDDLSWIAIKKSLIEKNPELLVKINTAIWKMYSNWELKRLKSKWFKE